MSKKKYTENDLRAAINETRLETRGKQIERSAGIMQAYADKISVLEGELVNVTALKNDLALKDHKLDKALDGIVSASGRLIGLVGLLEGEGEMRKEDILMRLKAALEELNEAS
jgi:hypothetical protein